MMGFQGTRRATPPDHLVQPTTGPRWGLGLLIGCLTLVSVSGCAAYRFGSPSMFRPGIRTIHVPVVRNDTFRHDLGVRLSEALVREIDGRTPYKVSGDPNADSTLACRVTSETKRVLTETDSDDPRALEAAVTVRTTWTSRNGEILMQNSFIPGSDVAMVFSQDSRFVPEAGQSVDTATQAAIEELAARIVSQMEIRW